MKKKGLIYFCQTSFRLSNAIKKDFMYSNYVRIFVSLSLVFGWQFSKSQSLTKLRVDPSRAYGANVSNMFSRIEYIPLETTKESLFGEATQLIITDSSYIVFDRDTRATFFFNSNGAFIKKIQSRAAYTIVYHYFDIILVANNMTDGVIILQEYDKFGKLLNEKRMSSESVLSKYFFPLSSGYYAVFNSCNTTCDCSKNIINQTAYLIDIYKGDVLYKSLLPYNIQGKKTFCTIEGRLAFSPNMVLDKRDFYISTPIENIIYKVNIDTAIAIREVVLSQKYDIDRRIFGSDSIIRDSLINNRSYYKSTSVRNITNVNMTGNLLLFKLDYFTKLAYENGVLLNSNFIYNLKTDRLFALERITSDASSYFLPIFNRNQINVMGLNYRNGHYYTSISSLEMFTSHNANKSRNVLYPSTLQQYFKNQNRKSNPVIVKLTLRD
ncbi:6-bladed beta-propeller [Niabella sp. 22666]|uniref:6-bladed beta-propeller n=1 Tax=Niabella sp. 22666 TaxID=3453954 RepID=UPI003F851CC2